jgi:gliding motility-associated-like protein
MQTVTVIDSIDPSITCAAPVSVTVDAGTCSADASNVNLGTPTTSDNCSVASVTNDAPAAYPLGDTTVTWTVTDGSGNTATCMQTVTVIDNEAPIFIETLPSDGTFECDNVPDVPELNASDPCGNVDIKFTETRIDGSCDSNYTLERKWVATDENGLSTTHTQMLTIQDTKAPEPTNNFDSSLTVNCENIPEIPALEFMDNCSNTVNVSFEEVSDFDEQNPSDYNILRVWTVSDDCNNTKTYTQTINVLLNNFVTTLSDRACYDDGAINLNNYLESNQTGGNWVVLEGNVRLDQNIFNPENVALGAYKFSYATANGSCLNTIELSIEIHDECIPLPCGKEDVIISKVVTPNGDPYNEYFTVTGVESCGFEIELQIFNRWGAKIYESSNYQNNWNGYTHHSSIGKAEKVPNGTYFYIINLKNSGLEPIAKAFYVGTK